MRGAGELCPPHLSKPLSPALHPRKEVAKRIAADACIINRFDVGEWSKHRRGSSSRRDMGQSQAGLPVICPRVQQPLHPARLSQHVLHPCSTLLCCCCLLRALLLREGDDACGGGTQARDARGGGASALLKKRGSRQSAWTCCIKHAFGASRSVCPSHISKNAPPPLPPPASTPTSWPAPRRRCFHYVFRARALMLCVPRPHRKMVQHNGGSDRNVEAGGAATILGDVDQ